MLSVSAETAAYSQQAIRTTRAADQGNGAPKGFSSLVDSNNDAAAASRDDGAHQPSDRPVAHRADDNNSTPAADAGHGKSEPGRGDSRVASGANGDASTTAGANEQQQPAPPAATADALSSTDVSAAVAHATAAGTVAQGTSGQGKDKTAKTDGTGDGSTTDATQQTSADQTTTLVVAVIAQVTTANSTTPAAPNAGASQTAVATVAGAPGAIAAAAASKVAADVAATEPGTAAQPAAAVVQGPSSDAKAAVTDQALAIVAAQQPTSQPADQTTAQAAAVGTAAVQGDAAALAQAVGATQKPAPSKTGAAVPDAKTASDKSQPAIIDPLSTKVAATDDSKAAGPIAPKKPATTVQAHDAPDQLVTKAQTDADASAVVPTVHQHAATEGKIAASGPLGAADLSSANVNVAQAAAAATPAPTPTTALNTANLTVLTGQAVPLTGLAVEISANAKAGNSRFEIRLDPPDLGRIDVRLDVDKNGQVTSRLFVEKSETLDLLRRDAPQLQQALQDAGLKTSDNGLQFSLRDQNSQQGQYNGNNSGNGQNPQRLVIAEDDAATATAAGRSYGRSLSASGGVDIRV